MSENLGTGVSYVYDSEGYNNVMVVFQKGKPPLDSELNLVQEQQRLLARRQLDTLPSGWLSLRPPYTNTLLENDFYTQNPTGAVPEYAIVNGIVLYVTNTGTTELNSNLIALDPPPPSGNEVHGIILEVWRALLDPDTDDNRPDSVTAIDAILDLDIVNENKGWSVGENGQILFTNNGGLSWNEQLSNTKRKLNGVSFISDTIGWAVGDNGIITRTTSGGALWTVIPSGLTKNFNDVYSVSQLISWIVGDTGVILKATNGVTWLPQVSNVTVNLNSVYFYDNLVGWVVGNNGTILKTTNGGLNWITMSSGVTVNLSSVIFYGLNIGFAVGANGTILRSSDGGLTWVNQSGSVKTGTGYTSLSVDLTSVTMIPTIDTEVIGEEVSSQFLGPNKNFTVMNVPITRGNGLGLTTNNPADVTVTVNAVSVLVDSVNGTTGQIILHEAPRADATVKVTYWYKGCGGDLFKGNAWITGKSGTLLATNDIGANWFEQDSDTAYDLNAVEFSDDNKGWVVGNESIIRHTENGNELTNTYDPDRTVWTEQKSNVIVHQVRRVYNEGNVGTVVYLNDQSIHPDTNIETTKRVQVQYRIRIEDNVDPSSYPDSGLGSSAIVGLGPNPTGSFSFQNMGPVTGDYGLWEADCSNTVDGKCWAIPMFFVNRRNSTPYDPETNSNGSHTPPGNIRFDFLKGTNVVESDIWDVRRKVLVPSVGELFEKSFDALLDNQLRTRFFRNTFGGDKYGTQLLQLDRVAGSIADGGTEIVGTLPGAVNGDISSNSEIVQYSSSKRATEFFPDPVTVTLSIPSGVRGVFHPNLVHYSALYDSLDPAYDGRTIPGYFTGVGTESVTFVFGANTNTTLDDPNLQNYIITADYVKFSTSGLTAIPEVPRLVKNYGTTGTFFYQGVNDETSGRIVEQWDTGISGSLSYSYAYPALSPTTTNQETRASSLEVHWFLRLTGSDIIGANEIAVSQTIQPTTESNTYSIYTVRKINNTVSGFSYRLDNISFNDTEGKLYITSLPGYEFLEGAIVEIIAAVESNNGNDNVRNGATVNFTPSLKKIGSFCKSEMITDSTEVPIGATLTITSADIFLGVSATETELGLAHHFCWFGSTIGAMDLLVQVTVAGLGTNEIVLTFLESHPNNWFVTIQALLLQSALPFPNPPDGLLIGYDYVPYQSVTDLPLNLTVETVTKPTVMNISNLGTGGSSTVPEPYNHPLNHIPTNDVNVADDNEFYNQDRLRFSNISLDTGFVQMPVYVPGSLGTELELSDIKSDNNGRAYYNNCSRDFQFITEGLQIAVPRKIFIGVGARVKESSDGKLLKGEYVLLVISRNELMELGNYTGYKADDNSVIAVYRLPNKPIVR